MKYIVTGGGGFVGKALCLELRKAGHQVVSLARGRYPELEAAGVTCLRANIGEGLSAHYDQLRGAEGVFHTAAKVAMWGNYRDFEQTNVKGTWHVIEACRACGIRRLVYTSSPSVIADGSHLRGVDEGYPYPRRHHAFYPATKSVAERLVLAANGSELASLALRPHLIWGPVDTNLVPTILDKARRGKLVRVGSGGNRVDLTFIEDCVAAHLRAMEALYLNPACSGKAYFISQGDPVPLWEWIDEVLVRHGLPKVQRRVPVPFAWAAAAAMEFWASLTGTEPLFTRFLVSEMSTDHFFRIDAAKRELGYAPSHTVQEALDATFPCGKGL